MIDVCLMYYTGSETWVMYSTQEKQMDQVIIYSYINKNGDVNILEYFEKYKLCILILNNFTHIY